jgi:ABC-type transport system involved in multi-copper enzyme maturation permease subunit
MSETPAAVTAPLPVAPVRDTTRALPFRPAARAVFDLSLEGMLWTRRSLLMALLVALPFAFALLYRTVVAARAGEQPVTPADLYALVVAVYWIRHVLPLMALFHATSLISDEIEGRTLTYLTTRPLAREAIFAGKFAAYLATTLSVALPAVVLTFFTLVGARGGLAAVSAAAPDLFRDLGVVTLTLAAYGAFFALLGVLLKRPVVPGLMFLYGWEMLRHVPGYFPRLTLTAWLTSLIDHRPAQQGLAGLFEQVLPAWQALPVLLLASAAFLYAGSWIFARREYVLDQ